MTLLPNNEINRIVALLRAGFLTITLMALLAHGDAVVVPPDVDPPPKLTQPIAVLSAPKMQEAVTEHAPEQDKGALLEKIQSRLAQNGTVTEGTTAPGLEIDMSRETFHALLAAGQAYLLVSSGNRYLKVLPEHGDFSLVRFLSYQRQDARHLSTRNIVLGADNPWVPLAAIDRQLHQVWPEASARSYELRLGNALNRRIIAKQAAALAERDISEQSPIYGQASVDILISSDHSGILLQATRVRLPVDLP